MVSSSSVGDAREFTAEAGTSSGKNASWTRHNIPAEDARIDPTERRRRGEADASDDGQFCRAEALMAKPELTDKTNNEFPIRGVNHLALVCKDMARPSTSTPTCSACR